MPDLSPWPIHTALWPKAPTTIDPTWSQWLSNLVLKVNEPQGPAAAGTLTGTTLAPNVVFSSLTTVGVLVGGSTGAGFTVALGTSTITGVLTVPNGGTGISTLPVNRIPYGNGTNPFQSDADLTFDGSTFTLNGLANLSGAAGGQIQFPATQNASANANTFDDYEEGTWTPTDASGAGLAFLAVSGSYLKIGQAVIATGNLQFPATASGAAVIFGGLPFTARNAAPEAGAFVTFTNSGLSLLLRVLANTTTIAVANNAAVATTNAALTNATIHFTAVYRATA